MLDKPLSW